MKSDLMRNTNLLPSEQESVELVNRIGRSRAERILNSISRRFERRYQSACDTNMVPINPEWIYKTKLEVELTFKLKMGLALTDDYFTPAAAKARILKRIEERNLARAKKLLVK